MCACYTGLDYDLETNPMAPNWHSGAYRNRTITAKTKLEFPRTPNNKNY